MESEQKNSYLFYFIITLILLGFIASLLPLRAKEYRLSDAGLFMARDTVTDNKGGPGFLHRALSGFLPDSGHDLCPRIRRDHEEESTPEPLAGLQS
jgi:hypothetical protein